MKINPFRCRVKIVIPVVLVSIYTCLCLYWIIPDGDRLGPVLLIAMISIPSSFLEISLSSFVSDFFEINHISLFIDGVIIYILGVIQYGLVGYFIGYLIE